MCLKPVETVGIHRLVFTVILLLLAASPLPVLGECKSPEEALKEFAVQQSERQKQGKKLLTAQDLVERYCDKYKKQILEKQAASGGPFFPMRGRWDLVDKPSVALPLAIHEDEPFNEKILGVLEKMFPLSKEKDERFRIAALLYRYGRSAGRDYLFEELRRRDNPLAALVLALNQELEALDSIAKVFKSHTPKGELFYDLIKAFGRWGPESSDLLEEGLLTGRGSRGAYLDALAMSKHEVGDAVIERIKWMFEAGRRKKKTPVVEAAVLVWLRPNLTEPLEYLRGEAEKLPPPSGRWEFSLVWALSRIEPFLVKKSLIEIVESVVFSDKPIIAYHIHVLAAHNLIKIDPDVGGPLVVKMLRKMAQRRPLYKRKLYAVAQAIYDSGLQKSDEILNEIMGEGFAARIRKLRELRSLPEKLLPNSSREFVREWYLLE